MLARAMPTPTPLPVPASRIHRADPPPVPGALAAGVNASPAFAYDDALPVAYTTLGQDPGAINVRFLARPGEPVDLAAYGGPPLGFLLRSADANGVRFSVLDGKTLAADAPLCFAAVNGADTRARPIYEQAGTLRISFEGSRPADGSDAQTFLFEFPVRTQLSPAAGR